MPILALGVSYRRAPVELLERVAFGRDDLAKAYRQLLEAEPVRGGVILSTCNRVEVYAEVDAYHPGLQAVRGFLAESRGVDPEEVAEPLYSHYEDQASEHLFSVAAGLDSMVQGELQILSQVRQAYLAAESERAAGPVLSALFRRAIRTGRRARAETAIGASPSAFVEAGAELAERSLGGLAGRALLLVGAGNMAELALRHLLSRRMAPVAVVSRSEEKAVRLAGLGGGHGGPLADLARGLAEADLVVSGTGATGLIVDRETMARAVNERGGRAVFVLDLAVPRDVDPAAGDLPGVTLANLDHLKDVVAGADESEIRSVRRIVSEEVARFSGWRRATRLAPVIEGLYQRGERVRRRELERVRARLADLTDEERAAVEAATRAIVAKLLHDPVVRAKALSDGADHQARLLAQLFGLEDPPPA
jgi:glutamyl-tRNA reductase